MNKRIVIVGSGIAGIKAALTALKEDSDTAVEIFTRSSYIEGSVTDYSYLPFVDNDTEGLVHIDNIDKSAFPGIRFYCNTEVTEIMPLGKQIKALDLKTNQESIYDYDSLILAVGINTPIPEIEGINLKNIYFYNNMSELQHIRSIIKQGEVRKVVVYGGSMLGLKMVLNLWRMNVPVTWVEGDRILSDFDPEISELVKKYLEAKGVEVISGEKICTFIGNAKGEVVEAHTPERILQTDLVIWTSNLKPEVGLALQAGIKIGETGAVAVNKYLETSIKDIYCVGDCAENINILTKRPQWLINSGVAYRMGMVAGINAVSDDEKETYEGTLGTAYVKVFDTVVAKTGLSTAEAEREGFVPEMVFVPLYEQQGLVNNLSDNFIVLTADRISRRILGVQAIGCDASGIAIDVIASAIHMGADIDRLYSMDLSNPALFSQSIYHPVTEAARILKLKLNGRYNSISPAKLQSVVDGRDTVLLDIRTMAEVMLGTLPNAKNIPFDELIARMNELHKDKTIVIISNENTVSYKAYRMLKDAGYENVLILDGGIKAYPYKLV